MLDNLIACLSLLVGSQTTPDERALLDSFGKLAADKQAVIVQELETAITALDLPLCQTVATLCERDDAPKDPLPLAKGPVWHDPKTFAPNLPIARKVLPENDPRIPEARGKFLRTKNQYELEGFFHYSMGENKIYRLRAQQSPLQKLELYLKGYPPNADKAREILLSVLDDEEQLDEQGKYFDHAYSDRDGNVYPGITIYDVWNSGKEIEMPDIDAIPFARAILKDNSYKSPIPDGPGRTRLYQKIGEHFQSYRRYRELREAVAGYFLAFSPPASPFVEPMRDRFHFLIVNCGGDPFMVRQFLKSHGKREELIGAIDELIQEMGMKSGPMIQQRKNSLENDHRAIRETVIKLLQAKLAN